MVESAPPQKYYLGDMVWAKVSSHPWWPAMVYYGPDGGSYTQPFKAATFKYHVQFFGPMVERAWMTETRLIPYMGKALFDDHVEDMKQSKDKATRDLYTMKMKSNIQKPWSDSWREADIALLLDQDERVRRFGRVYVETKKTKKGTASAPNTPKQPEPSPAKRKSDKVNFSGDDNNHELSLTAKEDDVAFINFLDEEKSSSNDLESTTEESALRERWDSMETDEKRTYLSIEPASRVESKSGRKIKPSVKSNIWSKGIKRRASDNVLSSPTPKKSKPSSTPVQQSILSPQFISDDAVSFEIQRLISSPADFKIEQVCPVCEIHSPEEGAMLRCQGGCYRWLHPHCAKYQSRISSMDSGFKCMECMDNSHRCLLCSDSDPALGKLIKCEENECGRYYHESCVSQVTYAKVSKGRVRRCPAHFCVTCANEDPESSRVCTGDMIHCIRCPMAFHSGDLCTAAGSIERSLSHVVCPKHFEKTLLVTNKPVHINWCLVCKKVATQINCEKCPLSYHAACLGLDPEDAPEVFTCDNCSKQKPVRYAQIVWAKLQSYRWWPCEVIHPRNAPLNILQLPHPDGAFPVHFLGADEYVWISKKRVFPYEYGLNSPVVGSSSSGGGKLQKMFAAGVKIGPSAHRLYVAYVSRRVSLLSMTAEPMEDKELTLIAAPQAKPTVRKMATFKFIKENVAFGEAKIAEINKATWPRCNCSSDMLGPCSADSNCSNVLSRVECHADLCPAGDLCQNQVFSRRKYTILGVFETKNRGHGLKALGEIKLGTFVNEYVGEVVEIAEAVERLRQARKSGTLELYMMILDSDRIIDAGPKGNLSRYINHSCDPNLEVRYWRVNGDLHAGLFAIRDITQGEELTFNYFSSMLIDTVNKQLCLCGAHRCSGYIITSSYITGSSGTLVTPNSSAKEVRRDSAMVQEDILPQIKTAVSIKPVSPSKRGRKSRAKTEAGVPEQQQNMVAKGCGQKPGFIHENLCYRCGDGGELVLCDKENCPKAYHLNCLGLTRPPSGIWFCPWHYCDDCGRDADYPCGQCPNSFCDDHKEDRINDESESGGLYICADHRVSSSTDGLATNGIEYNGTDQEDSHHPNNDSQKDEEIDNITQETEEMDNTGVKGEALNDSLKEAVEIDNDLQEAEEIDNTKEVAEIDNNIKEVEEIDNNIKEVAEIDNNIKEVADIDTNLQDEEQIDNTSHDDEKINDATLKKEIINSITESENVVSENVEQINQVTEMDTINPKDSGTNNLTNSDQDDEDIDDADINDDSQEMVEDEDSQQADMLNVSINDTSENMDTTDLPVSSISGEQSLQDES